MIVINPPAAPGHLALITRTPEHRAVETAIRIARVPFQCAEATSASSWSDLLRYHGDDVTFVLDLNVPISLSVFHGDKDGAATDEAPMVIDGAQGVLELAAFIASIAGPGHPLPKAATGGTPPPNPFAANSLAANCGSTTLAA